MFYLIFNNISDKWIGYSIVEIKKYFHLIEYVAFTEKPAFLAARRRSAELCVLAPVSVRALFHALAYSHALFLFPVFSE